MLIRRDIYIELDKIALLIGRIGPTQEEDSNWQHRLKGAVDYALMRELYDIVIDARNQMRNGTLQSNTDEKDIPEDMERIPDLAGCRIYVKIYREKWDWAMRTVIEVPSC